MAEDVKSDSVVIIPTYNEKENIRNIIEAVFELPTRFDVLIIDDNSPDGTAAIVKEMQKEHTGRLHLLERSGKLGLGTAYIMGFKWSIAAGYDFIIEMDADFSHPPRKLLELRQACLDGADVAIGSRYISGVNVVNWPMGRVLMSYYASAYVRMITGLKIKDTTAGFVCYRRKVLETIDLDSIKFKGYAFQIEMKFTARKCGFKIVEVPIIFVNREKGTSKMSSGIFGEAVFGVIQLKVSSWFKKYPKAKMSRQLIYNAEIVNERRRIHGYIVVEGSIISEVSAGEPSRELMSVCDTATDVDGATVIPGVIDDQVHFREPGLTHKAEIATESRAAVAGGVTSFMDMPNTKPPTVTLEALEEKYSRAAEVSPANYAFFIGATNDNIDTLKAVDYTRTPGVKLFLGSSTGNMLVDNKDTLKKIFTEVPALIAIHSEDEALIRRNREFFVSRYGDNLPMSYHPLIRSNEACYKSTLRAVEMARRYGTRLHILHLSTAKELELLDECPLSQKRITAEVCVHHLWFTDDDYARLGNLIKWNPAVKTEQDRNALREAVASGLIDIVATDHAPHLLSEKQGNCLTAASGGPLIQHSLQTMLELVDQKVFTLETVVDAMCHRPAELFHIDRRGYIRKGYYADLVVIDRGVPYTVRQENILTKCGWSPFEGYTFHNTIQRTYVNGVQVYNQGTVNPSPVGERLIFNNN